MSAFILEFNNTLLPFLFFTLACNNGHWEHSGNNCRKCWGHWGRVRGWWPKSKGRHKSKSGLFQPIEITGNVICIIAFSVSIYIFANRLNDAMNADVYHLLCKWTMHVTFFLCKLKVFVCKLSCYYACTYSIGHMQSLYESFYELNICVWCCIQH